MRRNGKVMRNVDFTCFQISALTVFLLLSVIFVSGCQKEKEQITRRPPPTPTPQCTAINPPAFRNQAAVTPLARREVCVPVGECVAANTDTRDKMALHYCVQSESRTCRPGGGCSSGSCKPVFDSANSTGVDIAGCAAGAAGPPGCAAGEELCKCDLSIAPRGVFDCDCGCR